MSNYQQLKVWQMAMDLLFEIYVQTKQFPKDEKFGLVSQMRRAAVSIASNIAEGSGRDTKGSFSNFIKIANGSTCELETQILIAQKLGYLSCEKSTDLTQVTSKIQWMLFRLSNSFN